MHEMNAEYLERLGDHEASMRERARAEAGWLAMLRQGVPAEEVERLQARAREAGARKAKLQLAAAARQAAKKQAVERRRAFKRGRRPGR